MPKELMLIELPELEWIGLLKAEVAKPGRTKADVAREIGMPRPSLSLLLSGNYPAKLEKVSKKFAAKVVAIYKREVLCQHLRKGISSEACLAFASAPMSISDPAKLRHYRACLSCPSNPITVNPEVNDAV